MTTSTIDAGLVEQSLPNIFTEGIWPIDSDHIRLLNFDDAKASHALNPQHVVGDIRKPTLPDRQR